MGQSPSSASRYAGHGQGDALIVSDEGRRAKLSGCLDDDGVISCCFLLFRREGRHRAAFIDHVIVEEEEPPPDAVLTDVEDEVDDEEQDGSDKRRRSNYEEGDSDGEIVLEEQEEDAAKETTPPAIPEEVLSRIVAVDCGMVQTPKEGIVCQALRRVCIVDGYGHPLLSALVRVDVEVDDDYYYSSSCGGERRGEYYYEHAVRYLSSLLRSQHHHPPRINGHGDNLDIGVAANEVKEDALKLLRGKIVVGHSVECDLAILGLGRRANESGKGCRRDFEVRDTANYEPFKLQSGHRGEQKSMKLRDLVKMRLHRKIQPRGKFHCCEEDAVAALGESSAITLFNYITCLSFCAVASYLNAFIESPLYTIIPHK